MRQRRQYIIPQWTQAELDDAQRKANEWWAWWCTNGPDTLRPSPESPEVTEAVEQAKQLLKELEA
jgi:hypothetical protein